MVKINAVSLVEVALLPYKTLLEEGTYQGQDWSSFERIPQSRYETFKSVFEHFVESGGSVVVELGTSRSFTHGGHVGCNSDDINYWTPNHPENWDWGAGFFTRMAAVCLNPYQPVIHTVDIIPSHIQRCRIMLHDYQGITRFYVSSSENFLKNCEFPNGIDILYIDTGDMTPIEPTALLQLEEAKIIVERDLISENGLILIDDVKNQTPKKFGEVSDLGKAKYSIPYFLDHGYEIMMDEYQVILRKSETYD